ncbi:MAG: hypothetical protein [Inoviridae sp.]|nr:MAG: hypothetical protein [Inoviridae sp.]
MAISSVCLARLRSAHILLTLPLLSSLFAVSTAYAAYTPPETPDVPLYFEFTGLNAEAEADEFRTSQCDSNLFSWYSTGQICAVGDPTNPTCSVWMAYHATDVNQCKGYELPEQPTPLLEPDVLTENGGNNQNLINKLELMRIQDFNKNFSDGQYQGKDISLTRQTNSLLSSLSRSLQYSNDNRSVVDAINTWGSSHMIETQKQYLENTLYRNKQDAENKVLFGEEMGLLGRKLNYMHDTLIGIENKTGSGGTGSGNDGDYMPALNYIANSIGNLSSLSTIANNTSSIPAINNILSGSINSNIEKIATEIAKPVDNSLIVDQLIEANDGLTDIVIRMRDIESAIGKSEKGIVDAIIENGSGGDGTDPDIVSESGCTAFSCSTDSPECYIARKAWERSCAIANNDTDGQGVVDSLVSSLKDYNDSPDSDINNIDAGTVDTSALMNKYTDANGVNFGGSDTCPPPYFVDAGITSFTLDLKPFCDLAGVIRVLLIAFATIASGLMVVKYF